MLRSRDFWIGVGIGLILLWVYQNYVQNKGKKS